MPYHYFFCFSHAAPHSSAEDIHLGLANQKWFKQYMRERELTLESGYNIWTAMTKDDGQENSMIMHASIFIGNTLDYK